MTNLGNCKWKFNKFDMSCHGNRMSHLCCDVCQCETSHSTLWKDELSCRCNTQFLSVKHLPELHWTETIFCGHSVVLALVRGIYFCIAVWKRLLGRMGFCLQYPEWPLENKMLPYMPKHWHLLQLGFFCPVWTNKTHLTCALHFSHLTSFLNTDPITKVVDCEFSNIITEVKLFPSQKWRIWLANNR